MQLTTCCRCCSLKTGTIFSGVCGIVLAVLFLILIFTANVEWKTIIVDILDKTAVKIIFAINLCMTILISTLLIIGALRASTTLNWNWFKWDQQLEKISNVSVSQPDKLDVENIDWLKTS
ncbi:hypothetical protein G5I_09342 [Acromyrmex echinatior]|uniref:Uncharacterized protein n=1 Tax=Acromyrmex echinatior TaxID=103372 RepID=F4WTY9_ACREC|nr:hypothetical protein G5I_09342 [Acromyrmex echinatior]